MSAYEDAVSEMVDKASWMYAVSDVQHVHAFSAPHFVARHMRCCVECAIECIDALASEADD